MRFHEKLNPRTLLTVNGNNKTVIILKWKLKSFTVIATGGRVTLCQEVMTAAESITQIAQKDQRNARTAAPKVEKWGGNRNNTLQHPAAQKCHHISTQAKILKYY